MLELKRILCPIDFSEGSSRSLHYAVAIARWYHAPVTVLHVADARADVPVDPPFGVLPRGAAVLAPAETERLLDVVSTFAGAGSHRGVVLEPMVRSGRASVEILEAAADVAADLIVLGTHGHSGFDRLVLGSVTEKILRKARCCVLTVPPRVPDQVEPPVVITRILCPVAFSEPSMKALQCAVSLAEEADARLTVLHVADALSPHDFPIYDRIDVPALQAEYERQLRFRLREFVPTAARAYCTIEEQVRTGAAWQEILAVAEERQTQLVVMGVTARSAIDRAVFGSTAQQVVRQAVCPVLTIRQRER
jgi:nucleotide-binding universal stress UspA family protein